MKHLLIILSFLLIGCVKSQTSTESVQSDEKCLEECNEVVKKQSGVLFGKREDTKWKDGGEWKWFENDDDDRTGKYKGEIVNGKPNGSGTYTSPGGFKYVGELKNGKYHGKGTLYHRTGAKYEGEWKDNVKHGQGSHTFSDGLKIVGEFRRNRPWNATWYDKKGHFIKNTVNSIEKRQKGVLFGSKVNRKLEWYKTGDEVKDEKYVGEIKNGKPNGQGTEISTHGSKYVGGWKDGELHGQGRVTWSYENVLFQTYVGEWKEGRMWNVTGYGKDGKINRTWVNGKRHK